MDGQGRLAGKVAIVTGAASGIGLATAGAMAEEGATVTLTDLDEVGGEAAARATGGRFRRQNVVDEASWQALIAEVERDSGRLDILVNNAGTGRPGNPETTTLKDWKLVLGVNLDSVFLGCKYAIPGIRCNAIAPGPTLTSLMRRSIETASDPQAAQANWLKNVALGRFAEPEEIARMAVFLASDEAAYVTGGLFPVDGGYSVGVV